MGENCIACCEVESRLSDGRGVGSGAFSSAMAEALSLLAGSSFLVSGEEAFGWRSGESFKGAGRGEDDGVSLFCAVAVERVDRVERAASAGMSPLEGPSSAL